jgi:CMP-N,N'-diacetyllegionaminic acid synthase
MAGNKLINIAFIPVRGGSKGVPGKNIKSLAGKPLLSWTIEQAKNSNFIDDIYVSTDCPKIAKVARESGAKVPFLRPSSISGDTATTESSMSHFCDWAKDNNVSIDNLILLQATSPIRKDGRIDDAIKYFISNTYDSMLSVCLSHRFFWKKNNDGTVSSSYDYKKRPRRQDIAVEDQSFMETGSFYISKFEGFISNQNRLFGQVGLYEVPENESYEIDSYIDFKVCEVLMTDLIKGKK